MPNPVVPLPRPRRKSFLLGFFAKLVVGPVLKWLAIAFQYTKAKALPEPWMG